MITARNISTAKQIEAISCRNASSVLKGIVAVRVRNASNVLKTVFSPSNSMTVDVPGSVYGAQSSTTTVAVQTEVATAIVTGGTAPFTYLWSLVNDYGSSWTIGTPNAAATYFRANSVPAGDTKIALFKCTVTDANGQVVVSIDVNATADNYGGFA